MSAAEFLNRLEEALRGEVPAQVVDANLQYYRDYIEGEIRKGHTESQVLEELGDPRLIARTIIETQGNGSTGGRSSSGASQYRQREETQTRREKKVYRLQPWKAYLILILILVVVFVLIGTVFSLAFRILLSPVFWALVLIGFAVQIFRGRR